MPELGHRSLTFAGLPISENYPGIHQTRNFSDSEGVEVRITSGVDEPNCIIVEAFGHDVYLPDAAGLRELGEALIRASFEADRIETGI